MRCSTIGGSNTNIWKKCQLNSVVIFRLASKTTAEKKRAATKQTEQCITWLQFRLTLTQCVRIWFVKWVCANIQRECVHMREREKECINSIVTVSIYYMQSQSDMNKGTHKYKHFIVNICVFQINFFFLSFFLQIFIVLWIDWTVNTGPYNQDCISKFEFDTLEILADMSLSTSHAWLLTVYIFAENQLRLVFVVLPPFVYLCVFTYAHVIGSRFVWAVDWLKFMSYYHCIVDYKLLSV